MAERLSVDAALDAVLANVEPLALESIPLQQAKNRVLGAPVIADRPQPPFNRSMMDGFAVLSNDTTKPPVQLKVIGTLAAGSEPSVTIAPGEAIRIMTGAPVPPGADAVQMFENTASNDDSVTILKSVKVGQNIAAAGEELAQGAVAVDAGQLLSPARYGVCWALGAQHVQVYRQPKVAIITTGDELVELAQTPGPSQIRDSNRATISFLVEQAGGTVVQSSIARDQTSEIREEIRRALSTADVVILSGGVSAGDYDLVGECLLSEGVTPVFHKIHMKPGKPLWFGKHGKTPVLGLPGNPVSSMVTCRLFVVPLIKQLTGRQQTTDIRVMMPLMNPIKATGGRPTFKPGRVRWGQGVETVQTRGSGDQFNFSQANCLIELPANSGPFQSGHQVPVLLNSRALDD